MPHPSCHRRALNALCIISTNSLSSFSSQTPQEESIIPSYSAPLNSSPGLAVRSIALALAVCATGLWRIFHCCLIEYNWTGVAQVSGCSRWRAGSPSKALHGADGGWQHWAAPWRTSSTPPLMWRWPPVQLGACCHGNHCWTSGGSGEDLGENVEELVSCQVRPGVTEPLIASSIIHSTH